jgi:hypothetical protein
LIRTLTSPGTRATTTGVRGTQWSGIAIFEAWDTNSSDPALSGVFQWKQVKTNVHEPRRRHQDRPPAGFLAACGCDCFNG